MQFLNIIKTVLSILPLIIQTINEIEAAFPASGKGAQKLEVVKAALQGSMEVANETATTFEQLWPVISKVIATVVTLKKS